MINNIQMNSNQTPKEREVLIQTLAGELIESLVESHYTAGRENESISQLVAMQSYAGSSNPMSACAAAMLSTGKMHGPLTEARMNLLMFKHNPQMYADRVRMMIENGEKIPGLGNSFYSDSIDPAFEQTYLQYTELYKITADDSKVQSDLERFTNLINAIIRQSKPEHKDLFPNAAGITGAVANILNVAQHHECWYFITGRTKAWLEMFEEYEINLKEHEASMKGDSAKLS